MPKPTDIEGLSVKTRNEEYAKYVSKVSPKSRLFLPLLYAFLIGGLICVIGQSFYLLYKSVFPTYTNDQIGGFVACTLVFIASVLTGFGIYDKIGEFGGAGSVIPITGFANSVTSASMEHNREGVVLGVCANMFSIAGPVIVFGTVAAVVVGVITMIFGAVGA